jgi:hypothetical protein
LERGRGLQIVDALSIRWGYYNARMGGKVVWCQLARDDMDTDRADDPDALQQVLEAVQAHVWNEQALSRERSRGDDRDRPGQPCPAAMHLLGR